MEENKLLINIIKYKDIITLVGLFIICILLLWLLYTMQTEGVQCMLNPVQYYEEFVNTSCYCQNQIISSR